MAFDPYGSPSFGCRDVKVAVWNATNSYGTAVDIPSVQMMAATLQQVAAQLEGDDSITATAARSIGGQVQLRFGSISLAALEVMTGQAATSSLTTPNAVKGLKISGGDNMPYFGIVGQSYAEEGDGDIHVFIPKCKITGDIQLANLQYGQFAIPEMTVQAVDDATFGVIYLVEHETATAVAIPPANISLT